jgi:hypothetical protein
MKDIDARVEAILGAFTAYCKGTKAANKHFVIPEFFFRCREGPYPYRKLNGLCNYFWLS